MLSAPKPNGLTGAIAAYRADRAAALVGLHEGAFPSDVEAAVLGRLGSDPNAEAAFDEMALYGVAAMNTLCLCFEAELLQRTFLERLETERAARLRTAKLHNAVEQLRGFLNEIERGPDDRLSAYLKLDGEALRAVRVQLQTLERYIDFRDLAARQTFLRFGTTRKARHEGAGRIAAIGWIGEGIRRATREPHLKQAADIAQAALGGEVSIDQVRHASRIHRTRDWQNP